ncbi:MAG: DedA family protein [Thermodesulfobacteriota bacterium]
MFESVVEWLVQTIGQLGYTGITGLMFLESSFFPFPSEVVIPPAGYLASIQKMNIWLVIAAGTGGSLLGAVFNYWLALKLGRPFLLKYGKYLFISEQTLAKADIFFLRHGHISTFIARLLPGIRQYISLPAGLARMNLFIFCLFTSLGAGIWVVILALLGYLFGKNQELINEQLHNILLLIVPACFLLVILYVYRYQRLKKAGKKTGW